MSIWKQGKNERFHNKTVWIQYTDDGRSTALTIECGSMVMPRTREAWVPDTKRGFGMVRLNPIIRHSADTCIISGCHGCPDRYSLLYVAWNQKPSQEDARAYAQYCEDEKHPGFLGVAKSASCVKTAVKKYMATH